MLAIRTPDDSPFRAMVRSLSVCQSRPRFHSLGGFDLFGFPLLGSSPHNVAEAWNSCVTHLLKCFPQCSELCKADVHVSPSFVGVHLSPDPLCRIDADFAGWLALRSLDCQHKSLAQSFRKMFHVQHRISWQRSKKLNECIQLTLRPKRPVCLSGFGFGTNTVFSGFSSSRFLCLLTNRSRLLLVLVLWWLW